MIPGFYFFDKDKITNLKLAGIVSSIGILGSTISTGSTLSTFSTTGNRCCSGGDRIFLFNYDGGISLVTSQSINTKAFISIPQRPILLRNSGSTCDNNYLYAVNGTSNGLLGSTSNAFHRYDILKRSWVTLASCPFSVMNSEIAINTDLGDYIYYSTTSNFYRYSIVSNTWSSLASHGLSLGIHGLVYYKMKIYLASGNVLRCYDILNGSWSTLVSLPNIVTGLRMVRYRDNLYIIGLLGIMEYSIVSGVLRTINSTLNLLGDLGVGVIYGSAYIFAGNSVYNFL